MIRIKAWFNRNKKGVSLIETMIAVSTIAFLAVSIIPGAVLSVKKAEKFAQSFNRTMLLASIDTFKESDELLNKDILDNFAYNYGDGDLSNIAVEDIIKLSEEKNSVLNFSNFEN